MLAGLAHPEPYLPLSLRREHAAVLLRQREIHQRGPEINSHRLPRLDMNVLEGEEGLQRCAINTSVGRHQEAQHHVVGVDRACVGDVDVVDDEGLGRVYHFA